MTIDVYIAPASGPCRSVLMTGKYLGLDLNVKQVNLMAGDQLKPEYLKISATSLYKSAHFRSQLSQERSQSSLAKISISFEKMPIDLYLLPASGPCRAILMTANHLGIEVNKKNVDLFAQEQLKPEFVAMNPQHTVPTIDDNGFYLWESRAIQTYLANKYAPDNEIYPKDPQKRAVVDRMLYFDIGTLYKAEADYLYPQLFKGEAADPEKLENFKKALGFLEEFLSKTTYAAGNHLTLADFSLIASISFAELADFDFSEYPKITAWIQKLKKEVPDYHEINEVPIQQFKEMLKSRFFKRETMGIELYYDPASPPCMAVLLTAAHLGIKLNKKYIDLMKEEQLKPEFVSINPMHVVPTLHDDGFYLWESRAILTYLVNKYAPGCSIYTNDPKEKANIERMLYFDIGTLYKSLADYVYPQVFAGAAESPEKKESFKKALELFDQFLSKTTYAAANHITLADFSIIAGLSMSKMVDYDLSVYPKISSWMERLKKEIPNYSELVEEPILKLKEEMKSAK
ncbi:uncharacterized protein LOC129220944 [Uloborus diversus]|uniref:uncharacterized protein LOC129220944 n=1 Tax=Uloborus diversus TaxID=327109 RepID=UPI00240981E2|nr:uncharacterized protein LOC129220944 [Uloborus diversus]